MSIPLQVLAPADRGGEVVEPDDAEGVLARLYAADADRWVRANMVATLDGAAHGPDGRSGSINDEADLRVFTTLRSLADVVLAGAGTVRAERYGPPRARPAFAARRASEGRPPTPRLAVVTRSGRVPEDQGLFDGDRPALVVTCAAAGADATARLRDVAGVDGVLVAGQDEVDLSRALDALAERGLRQVLCEGGPSLLGAVTAAGAVDELCLTWSPVLVGGVAPRVVTGPDVDVPLRLASLLQAGSTLLGRWLALRDGLSVISGLATP